jgi:small-conductance mechanosensitive channel
MSATRLFDAFGNAVLASAATAAAALLAALLLHWAASMLVRRLVAGNPYARAFAQKLVRPLRWLLPALALQAAWLTAPADFPGLAAWRHATLLAIVAAATWLAVSALYGVRDAILLRHPIDASDNLRARRVMTQTTVLMRTLAGLVILLGVSTALMTFPDVRQVGASLLASAGLAGLVVGFAAKPVLGNVIAGMQIALVQPVRIDDVVIIEGEWGRIEEITGTYVVVRIWDQRRLIVPLQWFIEHPFQNWTRHSAEILGTVFLWTDYRLPVEALRGELERLCRAAPEWDGRVCVLQVTDASERAMQVRALVSSADSSLNWSLRCRVREGLIAFLQREHPEALPRLRAEMAAAAPGPDGAAARETPPLAAFR